VLPRNGIRRGDPAPLDRLNRDPRYDAGVVFGEVQHGAAENTTQTCRVLTGESIVGRVDQGLGARFVREEVLGYRNPCCVAANIRDQIAECVHRSVGLEGVASTHGVLPLWIASSTRRSIGSVG
jgi:hypothetical protein